MKKEINLRVIIITAVTAVLLVTACSSSPKTNGEIFDLRNHAEAGLELGNREAGRGNYENALRIIQESKRNALLADDPALIIRSCLSLGNVYLDTGRTAAAFSEYDQAIAEAQSAGNAELLAVSRIFYARGNLVSGKASAQSVLDEINKQQADIKADRLNIAFSYQAKSMALRALGSYSEAEEALKQSLDIYEKDLYLENASYSWYSIASIRSVAGNAQGAVEALRSSIDIDRRIENSWGLASSYRAMGDVYKKMGNNAEAKEAYERAVRIYEAMGNTAEATETRKRIVP